jgi:hypothetical protein
MVREGMLEPASLRQIRFADTLEEVARVISAAQQGGEN